MEVSVCPFHRRNAASLLVPPSVKPQISHTASPNFGPVLSCKFVESEKQGKKLHSDFKAISIKKRKIFPPPRGTGRQRCYQ